MKLCERLHLDPNDDIALDNVLRLLDDDSEGIDAGMTRQLRIMSREMVVLAYYVLEDNTSAIEHGTVLVELVLDYLFGAWRDAYTRRFGVRDKQAPGGVRTVTETLGREGCRREVGWMKELRSGLLWALSLGNQDAVARLAEYPGEDLWEEAVIHDDFGPSDKAYYILLAQLLRGDEVTKSWEGQAAIIRRDRKKKPKLLLGALDRIVHRDGTGFQQALSECLRQHVKRELPHRGLENKLALDPTILHHTALRMGMKVDVPEKYRDHLIIVGDG
jgi:hypothetical protein